MIALENKDWTYNTPFGMAAVAQVGGPVAVPTPKKSNAVLKINDIIDAEPVRLLILFDPGQEEIVRCIADVVGEPFNVVENLDDAIGRTNAVIVGLANDRVTNVEALEREDRIVITTHAIDLKDLRNEQRSRHCNYEYLYQSKQSKRRTLARYIGFILGQNRPHDSLKNKARTTLLSTTFPDIRAALPNMDILSVGADSVELRVDLLKESDTDGVPSLGYVGEQVMLLRERTELPIIFTTRCTKENGRFPMDDPMLFYQYLHKALQWGCEYIDVELWLPEQIRGKLSSKKGNSKIISAWHDFSGRFKWTSDQARKLFEDAAVHGDIVKMIALVNSTEENHELEYFRFQIQNAYSHPPFSGLNMGTVGQLSRTFNRVFTPITHPLLPMIAAPGQLSAAEINSRLHSVGQLPKLNIHAIGNVRGNGQAMFLEKCLNELSLPHQVVLGEHVNSDSLEALLSQSDFGGAYLNPPFPVFNNWTTTEAAAAIGSFDTIFARQDASGKSLVCDNATWKGIRATLTRSHVPSAFQSRPAMILANTEAQAAAAIYALVHLGIGSIYTVGFKVKDSRGSQIQQFRGIEDVRRVEQPFVIISALPAAKTMVATPLLKHYSNSLGQSRSPGKIFLDLANGVRGEGDSVAVAANLGWRTYSIATVSAHTMVETLRLLLGYNVGYDFVKLASGRSLYI